MNKEERGLYISQIQTDVSLISFLAVISVFFLGSLLSKFDSYDAVIKIPISFLMISTFGFLFSALILSNTVSEIIKENSEKVKKYILYGYIISEYFGVYLFVLSLPLTVNIITTNFYLEVVTLISTLAGLAFYQFMGFSVLERHFPKNYKIYSAMVILFSVLLFTAQLSRVFFVEISIIFLLFIILIAFLAPREEFK